MCFGAMEASKANTEAYKSSVLYTLKMSEHYINEMAEHYGDEMAEHYSY
jgi:hypothetical protein